MIRKRKSRSRNKRWTKKGDGEKRTERTKEREKKKCS